MNKYCPDKWVIIHFKDQNGEEIYKVLGSWKGGYLNGESWRLNSGITRIEDKGNYLEIYGSSGSMYKCYKSAYGTTNFSQGVFDAWDNDSGKKYSIAMLSKSQGLVLKIKE